MTNTIWAEITCTVPAAIVETVADFLLELTGNGVSIENRTVDTFNVEDIAEETIKSVKCYLPSDELLKDSLAQITAYLSVIGPDFPDFSFPVPTVSILKEEDWANSWKANFKPTRIGERLVIKPSWEEFAASTGDIILELDPGMAFGTGTHATTRLCLESLELLVFKENAFTGNSTVLDVGCGSGVLGIAAALFGASRVVAVDIDPIAITVTRENAAINDVSEIVSASETPLAELPDQYAIVLANILAEELVKMSLPLTEKVTAGGFLVLSGILTEREKFVIAGFSQQPLRLHAVVHQEEWCCIIFQKTC